MNTTRRTLLGATAALAAAPVSGLAVAAPAVAPPAAATPALPAAGGAIRALWDEVIDLSIRLSSHAPALTAADRGNGLPGWMYVSGEANDLGNARYDRLMAILKASPESADDVAIMARAATHADITSGPATFAGQRVAMAAMTLAA